jgi:hypothetical protein
MARSLAVDAGGQNRRRLHPRIGMSTRVAYQSMRLCEIIKTGE